MRPIAIYDMDKTITRRPTYTAFLVHAVLRRQRWRALLLPASAVATILYALGLWNRARLKEWNQRLFLGQSIAPNALARLVDAFAAQVVARGLRDDARHQIERDRSEGRLLVMATASYAFYAEAIGRALGFDMVIATRSVIGASGAVQARIDGENCYGAAKLAMIRAALGLGATPASPVRFYSDHVSDLPSFLWAAERVAVAPDRRLRAIAQREGWTVKDWR